MHETQQPKMQDEASELEKKGSVVPLSGVATGASRFDLGTRNQQHEQKKEAP